MLPLDLLGIPLAWCVLIRIYMSRLCTPRVRIICRNPEGFQQLFELQKYIVLSTTKDVSQNSTTTVIKGIPKPPLILFAPDETPHLIDFSFISKPDHHLVVYRHRAVKESGLLRIGLQVLIEPI